MSSLTRWDPIREATTLRDAMSQLFEHAVMQPGFSALSGGLTGQMDVVEAAGRYHCAVLLPGIDPESIELTVRQNTLSIKATSPEPFSSELRQKATYLLREFGAGEFNRAITFPKDVDGDRIDASYERGVLTVDIPLAQHAQPKRIAVREAKSTSKTEGISSNAVVEEEAERREPVAVQ